MSDDKDEKKSNKIEERKRPYHSPLSMWKEFDSIFAAFKNQFENHFWHPFRPFLVPRILEQRTRLPAMDFKEMDDKYVLTAELPGVSKEDVDISITNYKIEIRAGASEEKKEEECFLCQERVCSNFQRFFEFPEEIVPDKAEAIMKNGILEIILPKKQLEPKIKAKKLEVQ